LQRGGPALVIAQGIVVVLHVLGVTGF